MGKKPESYFTCKMDSAKSRLSGSDPLLVLSSSCPCSPTPPPHVQLLTPFFTWGTAPHSRPGSLAYSARPGRTTSDPLSALCPSLNLPAWPLSMVPHPAQSRRLGGQVRRRGSTLESSLQGREDSWRLPEIRNPTPCPAAGLTAAGSQTHPGLGEAGGSGARFGGNPLLC